MDSTGRDATPVWIAYACCHSLGVIQSTHSGIRPGCKRT